jgi:NAD+ diphosphatase
LKRAAHLFASVPIDRDESWRERAGAGEFDIESAQRHYLSSAGEVLLSPPPISVEPVLRLWLGTIDEQPVVVDVVDRQRDAALGDSQWLDLRLAARSMSERDGIAAYARALMHWHDKHRFCGACGAPTTILQGGHRRRCESCGTLQFPRIDPAIITLVEHQGKCLLGRQPGWPERRYSVLAGFVEPGESLEDAVRREVFEEAGVRLADIEYHSSQPWPFPSSLMLGFVARATAPTLNIGAELEHALWIGADELRAAVAADEIKLPPRVSVSAALIADWMARELGEANPVGNGQPF